VREADTGKVVTPPPAPQKMPRSRFLEASTLGLGGLIGAIVTVPIAGFAILPSFLGQKRHEVDMGPIDTYPVGKWFIATFMTDPKDGEVTRRTAFVRNNGATNNSPSFTIISNRCAHLGCPVQANGPTGAILGEKNVTEHTSNGAILLRPVVPAGFGCPCHGGQYDTEGNRTAGPPVRALDRYAFNIVKGHLVLLSTFSVSHVVGTGGQAKIYKYKLAGPGEHVDGPEQWFYPLNPPHH